MAFITAVEPDPRGSRRRALSLDGEPWRKTSSDVVKALGLRSGQEHDAGALAAAIGAEEPSQAHARALRLLSHSERSTAELEKRLLQDGYPAATAAAAVRRLTSAGLVDDERFADSLARSLAARGVGIQRAHREMSLKGVPDQTAAAALAEHMAPDAEPARALEHARRLVRSGREDPRRIAAALARKGFSAPVAWTAAREAAGSDDPGAPDRDDECP